MRTLVQFLVALAALLTAPLNATHDEAAQPRIVAVGDLHGDFDAWLAIAQQARLIDGGGRWDAGETVLVQLGDITDRGPDSLKIIRHLQELEKQAAAAGGAVIVLLGNHEAMNVIGDLRYVHPGEYEAFRDRRSAGRREATWSANRQQIIAAYRTVDPSLTPDQARNRWYSETPLGKLEHRRSWRPGGMLGSWAAGLPAIAKVGDTLFAHGGLSEVATRAPLITVNASVAAALAKGPDVDRSALEDPFGPLWYRGNVFREAAENDAELPDQLSRDAELTLVLERYGARRLLVAHTPSVEGIVSDLGGRLIRVDTGISEYYGGPASFLVIDGGWITVHQRTRDGEWTASVLANVVGMEGQNP